MTNRTIRTFVSKIFFLIFFATIPNCIYPSNLLIKITEYFANQNGIESLSPAHEQLVRDIIEEMGITKPIYIRKMNRKAIQIYGPRNAFAYLGNYIFFGEAFFKELTPLEQRFVIGHELAHLKCNHPYKRFFNFYSIFALALGISALSYQTMIYNKITPLIAGISSALSGIATINLLSILFHIFSRSCEYQADYESAFRLNNLEGALAFFKRQEKTNMYDYSKFINRLIATHPSYPERIAAVEKLTPIQ